MQSVGGYIPSIPTYGVDNHDYYDYIHLQPQLLLGDVPKMIEK